MAALDQVPCRYVGAVLIIEEDLVTSQVVVYPIHLHVGEGQPPQLLQQVGVVLVGLVADDKKEAVYTVGSDVAQQRPILVIEIIGAGDEQQIALSLAAAFNALGQGGEKSVFNIGQYECQRPRFFGNKAAGRLIGRIVEPPGDLPDMLPFGVRYAAGPVIQHQ